MCGDVCWNTSGRLVPGLKSPNCVFVVGSENEKKKTGCYPDILSHALIRTSVSKYIHNVQKGVLNSAEKICF